MKQEIAERRLSEKALQESNQRFEFVTRATTDVIWDWTLSSDSLWWNDNFQTVFGYPAAEAGTDLASWTTRVHPDDAPALLKSINEVIESGGHLWSGEYRFRRKDGSYAFVFDRGYVLHDDLGKAVRMIGAMQDITGRKQAEAKLQEVHQQLMVASREAGMAEVATGVLHNVGNVLNSVNVSSTVVASNIKKSKAVHLSKVVNLLREHEANLGAFFATDPRAKHLPKYLAQLAEQLAREQAEALQELALLQKSVEHIKDIVATQQSYAKMSGHVETLKVTDLVEDALRMNSSGLARHNVEVVKQFEEVPPIPTEKHKVVQILVNLISNAKQACSDAAPPEKRITLRVSSADGCVQVSVQDNGVGIPAENLTRIFAHGFTTRKNGHGFGLHSGALAAKEMGGSLSVSSDGLGKGASFILQLPTERRSRTRKTLREGGSNRELFA
ncbi:MAG: PAS domain-containing sensor histidine kinase [Verrucomicrobiales bacterium]|nr:PAS domain-containing sensor histidine kinase [Verrucomicrobiales bacterium]